MALKPGTWESSDWLVTVGGCWQVVKRFVGSVIFFLYNIVVHNSYVVIKERSKVLLFVCLFGCVCV